MEYFFAPMEGLTDAVYRHLHHKYFPGVTGYYTPFFSPTRHRQLTPREARELPPAASEGFPAVPQVMTKNAEDFLWAASVCEGLGYREINLNLGCPSGTVVSKGKGSGMLADPDSLDAFLDTVCAQSPLPVSVKTRLGLEQPEEFVELLEIFNRYPLKLLIVHPRVRKDFYDKPLREDWFSYAMAHSVNPLCRSGGICTRAQADRFGVDIPGASLMIGRGLIADPGMLTPGGTTAPALEAFFGELLEAYLAAFGGSRNAMFRLKEHWRYLLRRFEGSEKLGKRLRKTTDLTEYKAITREIFHTLPLLEETAPDWL